MIKNTLVTRHFDTISDCDDQLKKFLKDAPAFLSPEYLKAIEVAAPSGIIFKYVSLSRDKKHTAFYYFRHGNEY